MDRLTSLCREIVAIKNCPSVHALLLDVWEVYQARGEAEALLWLANVRRGVERYAEHERFLAAFGAWPKGVPGE